MIEIKFQANYLPNHREFNVLVKLGKKRLFEKMTISKFMRLAKNVDKPLVIDGFTIQFNGGDGEAEIRDYFKKVADSYLKYVASLN